MKIAELVKSFHFRFGAANIDNARRVAEELLAHTLHCSPMELYTQIDLQAFSAQEKMDLVQKLEPLAGRIEAGEPLQYVIGSTEFWGLEFKCDPRALIPRPETELLVEEVLTADIWQRSPTLVDVGTGTGCIALTLARQRPDATIWAVDRSAEALTLAQQNAGIHGLFEKVLWRHASLLDGFEPGSCTAIIANLPYISTADWQELPSCVREHEPRQALDSGPTGMELIEELANQARNVLIPKGRIFLEFGFDQGATVQSCLETQGFMEIEIKRDLAGHDRIGVAINPG